MNQKDEARRIAENPKVKVNIYMVKCKQFFQYWLFILCYPLFAKKIDWAGQWQEERKIDVEPLLC